MKLIGLEPSNWCAASASIFGDVTSGLRFEGPSSTFPSYTSSAATTICRFLADRLRRDPYLLTHSGTMTKCLIRDTRCGSVGVRMQNSLRSSRGEGSRFKFTITGSILGAAWLLVLWQNVETPLKTYFRGKSHFLQGTLSRCMYARDL